MAHGQFESGPAARDPQSMRAASAWFDHMVHKLSQPFTSMRCGLDLAAMRPDQGWPEKVSKELDRAVSIVQGFQALMRADLCGEFCEPVDAAQALQECANELSPQAEATQVTLETSALKSTVVFASPAHLREALWNVLVDCIQATAAGGTVTAAIRTEGGEARIELDDGATKAPASVAQLMEAFPSANKSTSGDQRGGFGLALADRSLRAMGGSLAITVRPKGNLRFTLTLRQWPDGGAA